MTSAQDARNAVITYLTRQGYAIQQVTPLNHERHYIIRAVRNDWGWRWYLKFDVQPFLKPYESIRGFPQERGESINAGWFSVAKKKNCILLFANPDAVYTIQWQQFAVYAQAYTQKDGEITYVIPMSKLEIMFRSEGASIESPVRS